MTDALEVRLHGQDVGEIVRFKSGRILFEFDPGYAARRNRPTLSQSFMDERGEIVDGGPATTSGELPPFFSNLLPEGRLRTYLADKAGVRPTREFELLELVGRDLPGAVVVRREGSVIDDDREADEGQPDRAGSPEILRFSLAGVQLKFSAVTEASGGLTVPAHGVGGDWILKLPSVQYEGVPENEYSVMSLARSVGIEVPETRLVPMDRIAGLPPEVLGGRMAGANALAVRRFDRMADGRVHTEDFAQVLGQRPADKYDRYTCADLARLLAAFSDERAVGEFAKRLMYAAIVGNGDMHTKNWSLIYRDGRTAELSPAYDLLCTTVYIPNDGLALRLGSARRWDALTLDDFASVADTAYVNPEFFVRTATEAAERFQDCWEEAAKSLPIRDAVKEAIHRQLVTVPAITGVRRPRRRRRRGKNSSAR